MQVLQILTCPVCLVEMNEPVSISCGHTMCKACLLQLVGKAQFPSCPLCRRPTFAPVGDEWQSDELLTEIIDILKNSGEEKLLEEFSQAILCLDCGNIPENATVLACQHLFCLKCINKKLADDLVCPACNEWAPYIPDTLPPNTKYNELIEWYNTKNTDGQYEKHKKNDQSVSKQVGNVNGMPVFFFDQIVHLRQKLEIMIVEERYIQMLKIVTNGSGNFPILTQMAQCGVQNYADLVQITRVKKMNQGQYYISIQGIHRIVINKVYTIDQNGSKIPFTIEMYKNLPGQLWMCNFEIMFDKIEKNYITIQYNWYQILTILKTGYNDLNNQLQEFFQNSFQMICVETKQKESLEDIHLIQDASLILTRILKIPMSDYYKLYYNDSIKTRLSYIWNHFQTLQSSLLQMLGSNEIKPKEKNSPILVTESIINLPSVDFEDEDDDDLEIIQFKELTLSQQIFMNLFRIENVLQSSD